MTDFEEQITMALHNLRRQAVCVNSFFTSSFDVGERASRTIAAPRHSLLPSPTLVARRALIGALLVAALLAVAGVVPAAAADRPPLLASNADAYVAHQSGSDLWSIGSADLELVVGFDAGRALTLQRLSNPATGRVWWDLTPEPDVSITIGSERVTLGAGGALSFVTAEASASDRGVVLTFTFDHRSQRLRIARSYACYPGSPTIETWTTITSLGGGPTDLSDLVAWQIGMPLGHVRWLGGLRGDSADREQAGAFELADRDLDAGERIEIGSDRRSTEKFIPFGLVDNGRAEFYGGLMWSGAWRIAFDRRDDRLRVSAFFPGVTTLVSPDRAVELPHAFFGLTTHSQTDESGALRQFILKGIRRGRPFQPLVTYNTWFAYGVTINERAIVAEMDRAASLGIELFVLDAGWHVGVGEDGTYDFNAGLGSWTVDTARFSSSLAGLANYAHELGLKFGLWIEPERVALSTVDKPGLIREAWLATEGGDYGQPGNAQICFVRPEARRWVFDHIVALIEQVRPDYLKWDNNLWVNCDRAGHGHGATDGGFSHVQALYGMLDDLRRRYPSLQIENASGGGNRLDFGMLAYTDVAWMDDRTSPSAHVRHNLEGLTFAFPPAYLLSFVINADGEPIVGNDDLALVTRSRMPGVLGFTYRTHNLDANTAAALASEISRYKIVRDIIAQSNATLLSAQAPVADNTWDVLQEVADDGRSAVIFAFKGSADDGRWIIRPRSLLPDVTYDVQSLDIGPIGSARGDVLMRDGIEVVHNGSSRAHVLVLTAQ